MARRCTPLLTGLLTLACAAPAQAQFTGSTVTTPASGARFLSTTAAPTPAVQVKGTTNNAAGGDTVNAYCYRSAGAAGRYIGQSSSTAGGTFTIDGSPPAISPAWTGGACLVRAVPTIVGPDLSPFAGRWVIFERQIDATSGGRRYDFDDFVEQGQGGTGVRSIGVTNVLGGGLTFPRLTDTAGQSNSADAFFYAGAVLRGDLTVDGHPAYPPTQAQAINAAATGLPALDVARSRDGSAGDAVIAERDPLVRCPTDVTPATSSNCPAFTDTGTRWDRTTTTGGDGTTYEQLDTFTSTDGAAHTLSVWLGYSALTSDTAITPAFGLSWLGGGAMAVRSAGETVGGSPGGAPGTLLMARNSTAADGDTHWPQAAVTWDPGPGLVAFTSAKDAAARFENVTIPAGGSATLRTRYVMGSRTAGLASAARTQRDAARAPQLRLTGPADGATFYTPSATITGVASDTESLASLVVAGRPVTPAVDGTFSVTVPLVLGANRIDAVATDGAGQTATAALSLTYRDTIAPALTALTLSRTRFRVGATATAVAARAKRRTPQGTTIRFTLGEPAPVTLAISRKLPGRRSKGRCVKPTRKLRRAARCTRLVTSGTLRRTGTAGTDAVAFSGRVGRRALTAGSYRLTATAQDASGNTSRAQSVAFTVVSR